MKTLDEIEAAARAATQGEWWLNKKHFGTRFRIELSRTKDRRTAFPVAEFLRVAEPDAEYIALCNPQTILALTADLRACVKVLCRAQESVEAWGAQAAREPEQREILKADMDDLDKTLQNLKKWGL